MTTTLQRVAAALKAANDELHAIVKYNVRESAWEIWINNKPAEVNFKDFDKAEDRCEELNYAYAARKVIEVIDPQIIIKFPNTDTNTNHKFLIKNNSIFPIKIIP